MGLLKKSQEEGKYELDLGMEMKLKMFLRKELVYRRTYTDGKRLDGFRDI